MAVTIADQIEPPLRFLAGADAIEGATAKAKELLGHDVVMHARNPERAAGLDALVDRGAHPS